MANFLAIEEHLETIKTYNQKFVPAYVTFQ